MTDTATEKTLPARREIGDPIEALVHFFIMASEGDHGGARVAGLPELDTRRGGAIGGRHVDDRRHHGNRGHRGGAAGAEEREEAEGSHARRMRGSSTA